MQIVYKGDYIIRNDNCELKSINTDINDGNYNVIYLKVLSIKIGHQTQGLA